MKKYKALSLVLFLTFVSNLFADLPWEGVEVNWEKDKSKFYEDTWHGIDDFFDATLIEKLKRYEILLVRGFLSNSMVFLGTHPWNITEIANYYEEQLEFCEDIGLHCKVVPIKSEESLAYNGALIADEINKSKRPVIILSHSKGGLDALEGYLIYTIVQEKIKGWIALQVPFFGTPLADYILDNNVLSEFFYYLIKKLGGAPTSLESMRVVECKKYYEENKEAINSLLRKIPTLSVASWKANEKYKVDTIMEHFRNWMLKNGIQNDGMIPTDSAILPNTDFIILKDVDHANGVMFTPFQNYDRVRFFKSLLVVMQNMIDNM